MRGRRVVVDDERHGQLTGDATVQPDDHLVVGERLIGDRCGQDSIGAGTLGVRGESEHLVGGAVADASHHRQVPAATGRDLDHPTSLLPG